MNPPMPPPPGPPSDPPRQRYNDMKILVFVVVLVGLFLLLHDLGWV